MEKKEAYPLSWPSDWPRTRPQDQKRMASWKRTATDYREELIRELERSKVVNAIISCNVQVSMRGTMTKYVEPRDCGVAIYFSRPLKEDFRWQDALGVHSPAPSDDEINAAYRKLAALYHPDNQQGGDREMFLALTGHRDRALAWAHRDERPPEHVIACDLFCEVRLNLAAIAFTLKALRQIDRCGTSALLERSFKGFMALAADAGPSAGTV